MKFYDNIESERDRIEFCIKKYGWTSDHHLDWWTCAILTPEGIPVFVEFSDGAGLLTHRYPDKWRIWSDPLSSKENSISLVDKFADFIFHESAIKEIWCDDISSEMSQGLKNGSKYKVGDIFYSLSWPILNMEEYDPSLPGRHFKEMRNAKNKFYREHEMKIVDARFCDKEKLYRIVDEWKKSCKEFDPNHIYDLKYRLIADNDFRGFNSARVIMADGQPVGLNAGYDVPNHSGRYAGIIGLHDYSLKDLGTVLWLEDLEWIKKAGYKELDMQGSEEGGSLDLKLRFGGKIERKTDTFSIARN